MPIDHQAKNKPVRSMIPPTTKLTNPKKKEGKWSRVSNLGVAMMRAYGIRNIKRMPAINMAITLVNKGCSFFDH
jgi:hypothetical protein